MAHNLLTLQGFLNYSSENFSDNNAFGFLDESYLTYAEFGKAANSLQYFLKELGVDKGDKVALFSQNMPNWPLTYFAITAMGAIVVPILPDFSTDEITNIMNHSESSLIFVSESLASKTKGVEKNVRIVKIEDFSLVNFQKTDPVYSPNSSINLDAVVDPDDLAAIIYTSGTTGKSKGVMLTHKNLCSNVDSAKDLQPVGETDRFISLLPLSHTLEQTVGMLIPFKSGATVTYLRKPPTAPVLLPALLKIRPTFVLAVPLIIEKIFYSKIKPELTSGKLISAAYKFPPTRKLLHKVAAKKLMKTFGGEVLFFGIGGAKVNFEVERFMYEGGFPYAIGYGLTETAPILAGMAPFKSKLESTGPAVKDVTMKISNPDPLTGEGEVWAKGPNVMKGYYKEPGLTAEVITEDGWFRTGDLGVFDKDGFLFIKGRSKNVIIGSSGENIYPEEIESVINNFKHVVESLVIDQKGKLVALVHINREEIEAKYQHLKEEMTRKVEDTIDEILKELHLQVNTRINKFSRLHTVVLQPVPFQKTATQKIKRYLYL